MTQNAINKSDGFFPRRFYYVSMIVCLILFPILWVLATNIPIATAAGSLLLWKNRVLLLTLGVILGLVFSFFVSVLIYFFAKNIFFKRIHFAFSIVCAAILLMEIVGINLVTPNLWLPLWGSTSFMSLPAFWNLSLPLWLSLLAFFVYKFREENGFSKPRRSIVVWAVIFPVLFVVLPSILFSFAFVRDTLSWFLYHDWPRLLIAYEVVASVVYGRQCVKQGGKTWLFCALSQTVASLLSALSYYVILRTLAFRYVSNISEEEGQAWLREIFLSMPRIIVLMLIPFVCFAIGVGLGAIVKKKNQPQMIEQAS